MNNPIHALRLTILALLALPMLISCSDDEADGSLSMLTAEMSIVRNDAEGKVASVVTDSHRTLYFTQPVKVEWAQTPDTTYRALVYYNKVGERKDAASANSYDAEPLSIVRVLCPKAHTVAEAKDWIDEQDGVVFVSGWRSDDYLNLHLRVLTGVADDRTQVFGLVLLKASPQEYSFRLCHNQNNVPKAYSQDVYLSVSLSGVAKATPVKITVPTDTKTLQLEY